MKQKRLLNTLLGACAAGMLLLPACSKKEIHLARPDEIPSIPSPKLSKALCDIELQRDAYWRSTGNKDSIRADFYQSALTALVLRNPRLIEELNLLGVGTAVEGGKRIVIGIEPTEDFLKENGIDPTNAPYYFGK